MILYAYKRIIKPSREEQKEGKTMKSIVIAGTVITNKAQATSLVARINSYVDFNSWEAALAADQMVERLVNAGFLTWEEADSIY